MADVIAAIDVVVPEAARTITSSQDVQLPLPEDMEASQPVTTPLRQGVRETIDLFRRACR